MSILFSEAQASVPGASNKLSEWLSEYSTHFSPWASSATADVKEMKFGTKVACPNFEYTHSAEKARNTTHDD